jgi:lipopolysaccharide transport system permease protein
MPGNNALPVSVRTADTVFAHPREFLVSLVRDVWRSRYVVKEMLKRDLTSQYRQSVLGVFLSLLPALATTAWAILFRSAHLINVGRITVPYPFFVLCGLMIWSAFLESIEAPIQGVLAELPLLGRTTIPPESVTYAKLGQVVVNFAMKVAIIVVAAAAYRLHVAWTAVLAPIAVAFLVALGAGIGLVLAPLNVLYRDVSKAMPVITTFWFFLTPIVFIPPRQGIAFELMERFNPVAQLLCLARNLIFPDTAVPHPAVLVAAGLAVASFLGGLVFHRIAMPVVIDRANS